MWKGGWWEEGVLGVEVEGRLAEEGMLDVEEVNMKKLKGGWWEEGVLGVEEVNIKKLKGGWWRRVC